MDKTLRSALIVLVVFFCGFFAKSLLVEAERNLAIQYVDECMKSHANPTQEQKTKCYGSSQDHLPYQIVSALNFQPALWKNTPGRCVGTKGGAPYTYFECRWWNEIAL